MNKETTDKISRCTICLSFRKNNCKKPLTVRDFGDNPWENNENKHFSISKQTIFVSH